MKRETVPVERVWVMVTVSTVVKSLGLLVAELVSSITDWFQTKPEWANLEVLEDTELKTTGGVHERHKARTLWEKTGAVVMVEAAELSSLKSQLQDLEVPLFAVVKENIGKELDCFKKYFSGKVYVDQQRNFYGPQKRWMFLSVFLRIGVWRNLWRAYRRGFRGNLRGEGLVLGGVFVIGPRDQGILLEHHEKEFGDKVEFLNVSLRIKVITFPWRGQGARCRCKRTSVLSGSQEGQTYSTAQMLALPRCSPALRWTLSLRCSGLCLGSATTGGQSSITARPRFLRTHGALFHQSSAKASPDPDKPTSGKDIHSLSGCTDR
ncbi:putative redox-regulatory protein FAM213A-like [Scophthalmus maximus]|uniref:Peroxiredoxin-like 2A n=1 Tax=Scophthalmus maximus TaxID=52904 RepID=A0A2U9CBM3_SCOMX|nr:putative redox-regulatory protein FAM213A-like [Scophthalmus maximus]